MIQALRVGLHPPMTWLVLADFVSVFSPLPRDCSLNVLPLVFVRGLLFVRGGHGSFSSDLGCLLQLEGEEEGKALGWNDGVDVAAAGAPLLQRGFYRVALEVDFIDGIVESRDLTVLGVVSGP